MTEQTQNEYIPEVSISYALAQGSESSYQKNLESAMQVLLHHLLANNIAVVDCVSSDNEEDQKVVPVIAAILEVNGQQAILPIGRLFTEDDKPSETLVPVKTDPRKVN